MKRLALWLLAVALLAVSCNEGRTVVVNGDQVVVTLTAKKKYLIFPIHDSSPQTQLTFKCGDEDIFGHRIEMYLATDSAQFYVPVDISDYRGKRIDIYIDKAQAEWFGVTALRQSNEYEFEYDEHYRQKYHMTPRHGWTNDPNGLVYSDGRYHLSYQANPYGNLWGYMHWGHATSKDLVHWKEQEVILRPDSLGCIFSGCAVVDRDNTTGKGANTMVAVYSIDGDGQRIGIAHSTDGGYSYTPYEGNPVIEEHRRDFRDPYVLQIDGRWVMAVTIGECLRFYESENLADWRFTGEFGRNVGSHDGWWECPAMFPIPARNEAGTEPGEEDDAQDEEGSIQSEADTVQKYVLLVSIYPHGPNDGGAVQYFIGSWQNGTFVEDPLDYPLWLDYGRDNYAGVVYSNTGERAIYMGWLSDWVYTHQTPTLWFRNGMTIPRDLEVRPEGDSYIVASVPSPEIYTDKSFEETRDDITVEGSQSFDILKNNDGAYFVHFSLSALGEYGFRLKNNEGEMIEYRFSVEEGAGTAGSAAKVVMDRSRSSKVIFNEDFASRLIVCPLVAKESYEVELFIDRQSAELFIDEGSRVMTNQIFPTKFYDTIEFFTDSAMTVSDFSAAKMGE